MYVDVSGDAPWDPRVTKFRDKVTDLASPIHGKPKYELASDDVREQRRFLRLRRGAIVGLVVLTVLAVAAAVIAVVQRQEALHQRDQSVALRMMAEGEAMLGGARGGGNVRALQEILAAQRIAPDVDTGALLTALTSLSGMIKVLAQGHDDSVTSVAFSPDGHRIVSGSWDKTMRIWNADTGQQIGAPLTGHD